MNHPRKFLIDGNKIYTQDLDTFTFHGIANFDRSVFPRQRVQGENTKLVVELVKIIKAKDIEKLRKFKEDHPDITLYHGCVERCSDGCECGVYVLPYEELFRTHVAEKIPIMSNGFKMFRTEFHPFVIGSEFFNALFECGYIDRKDAYIVKTMLEKLYSYEKWEDVFHLLEKMDTEALKSYVFEDLYGGENPNFQRYVGIGDAIYTACSNTYFGKPCEDMIKCAQLLSKMGILPHDQTTGEEIPHHVMDFWKKDENEITRWQTEKNIECWETRDISKWQALPTTPEQVFCLTYT